MAENAIVTKAIAVHVPRETVNDEVVKLVKWLADEGALVRPGQAIAEIETSKAVLEMEAPEGGYLRHRHAIGSTIPVGAILFYLTATPSDPLPEEQSSSIAPKPPGGDTRFSGKAQALIDEHGIDPAEFAHLGLVRESDVLALLSSRPSLLAKSGASSRVSERSEPLPQRKVNETRYLSAGQNSGLASSVSVLCATRGLRALARRKAEWGGSLVAVLIHEAARLLPVYPPLNAWWQDGIAHYYDDVNIGVAVDSGHGIRVPVIRDAARKSLDEIVPELQELMRRSFKDGLDVDMVSDGTFTITDLSAEGVFGIAPMINYRQSAILSVGAEFFLPGVETGVFQLGLTFDHRLTEGRPASAFLRDLRERLRAIEAGL